jgi:transposase
MAGTPPIPDELWNQLPTAAQAAVLALVTALEARIAQLEARLNQNSSNSSTPPSSDPPSAKPAPPKPPSGKSKGGQHGHTKHSRPPLPPDDIVELRAGICRHCRTPLAGSDPEPLCHQVIEIPPIRPHVTEYRQHRLTCPHCEQVNCAGLPADVRGGYGPRVQSVCALLSGAYRIGKRGVAQICKDLFGVPISPAAVGNLQHKTAEALAPIATEAQAHVVGKPANVDETSWSEGRKRHWLWTAVTRAVSVFVIRPSRARNVLTELIPGKLGVLTTDRYSAYSHLPLTRRQVCWAHLRRDFQAMIDRNDAGSNIGRELLSLADDLLWRWKRVREGEASRDWFRRSDLSCLRPEVRLQLERGSECGGVKTARVCRELLKLERAMYTFGYVEGVEPTNNAGERAVRHGVYWRKTSNGTDSPRGSRFVERVLTVVESCRQQARNILAFLTQAIQAARTKAKPPSLIPTNP